MSALGSLYIKLGEPDGELCGCTCEVGDWAAVYIADLIQQRDKLLAAAVAYRKARNIAARAESGDALDAVIAEVRDQS